MFAKKSTAKKAKMSKKEFEEMLGAKIIERTFLGMDEGTLKKWENPIPLEAQVRPFNPLTKNIYRGVNNSLLTVFNLMRYLKTGKTPDPRFITQYELFHGVGKEKGWKIKEEYRDKKPFLPVVHYSPYMPKAIKERTDMTDDEKLKHVRYYMDKYSLVISVDMIDGIAPIRDSVRNILTWTRGERQKLFDNMLKNSEATIINDAIEYNGGVNCYVPALDVIHLCKRNVFVSHDEFYDTASHEIAHSTGHASRLNRPMDANDKLSYAREEVVAELTSTILRMEFGGTHCREVNENHLAYLASWVKYVRENPDEMYKVIRMATDAVAYIKSHMMFKGIDLKESDFNDKLKVLLSDDTDILGTDTAPKSPRKRRATKKVKPIEKPADPEPIVVNA